MKKAFLFLASGFVLAFPAFAQIYNDKHDDMVEKMDTAAIQADVLYENVNIPGTAEDLTPQDERYSSIHKNCNIS